MPRCPTGRRGPPIERQHLLQHSPGRGLNQARPEVHHTDAGFRRRCARFLPGQQTLARKSSPTGASSVSGTAANRRAARHRRCRSRTHREECAVSRRGNAREGLCQKPRSVHPGRHDFVLGPFGEASADGVAGQVDHGVDVGKFFGVQDAEFGIPIDPINAVGGIPVTDKPLDAVSPAAEQAASSVPIVPEAPLTAIVSGLEA